MSRVIESYLMNLLHHQHAFYMTDTVRYFRDIICVRYLMELNFPSNEIFLVFVDNTILNSHICGHISASIPFHLIWKQCRYECNLNNLCYISETLKARKVIVTAMKGLTVCHIFGEHRDYAACVLFKVSYFLPNPGLID